MQHGEDLLAILVLIKCNHDRKTYVILIPIDSVPNIIMMLCRPADQYSCTTHDWLHVMEPLIVYLIAQLSSGKKTVSLRPLLVIIKGLFVSPPCPDPSPSPGQRCMGQPHELGWTKRLSLSKESWQSLSNLMKPLSGSGLQRQPVVTTKKTSRMKTRGLYTLNAICAT